VRRSLGGLRSAILPLALILLAQLATTTALAHEGGGPSGDGRIPGQPDFERIGKITLRFNPKAKEYEIRRPGLPTAFTHADSPLEAMAGSGLQLPKSELDPVCRTSGNRIVVVYTHRPGDPTPTPTSAIRSSVRRMNWKFNQQSVLSSGGSRAVKMAVDCNENDEINVYDVAVSNNESIAPISVAVENQLFGAPTDGDAVKYLVFDADERAGAGGGAMIYDDAVKGPQNENASSSDTAVAWDFPTTWTSDVTIHELLHTLGASQGSNDPPPPFVNPGVASYHCNDGIDILCYDDGTGGGYTETRCPASLGFETPDGVPIDCGEDTYFDADPQPGSWLDEYWNVAGPEDPFLVAPPKATTDAASEVGSHSAVLHGTLNPEGYGVSYRFEYGPSAEYGSSTPSEEIEYGATEIGASEAIADLVPATSYHFRLVAESDAGTAYGEDEAFTTAPPPTILCKSSSESSSCALANSYPAETPLEASASEVAFESSVGNFSCGESSLVAKSKEQIGDPLGLSLTAWSFGKCALGGTSCTLSMTNLPRSATLAWSEGSNGALLHGASLLVKCGFYVNCTYGLPGATLKGGSPASVAIAEGKLFGSGFCPETTTLKPATYTVNSPKPLYVAREGTAKAPKGKTEEATSIGSDHATLNATVNPEGSSTSYYFEYGETTSYGAKAPASPKSAGSGTSDVKVAETVEGLKAGATYHFRIVAENAGGTFKGEDKSFATASDKRFNFDFGTKGTGNGQLSAPYGVTTDSAGNVWVTDTANNRVQKFNSKGEYVSQFGSGGTGNGQFSIPTGIAVDSSGNVWVSDCGNNRVQEFNSKGEYMAKFGSYGSGDGQLYCPIGLAFNSSGRLFVVDNGNNRVQQFKASGEYVSKFGTKGTGNGAFESPQGIAFDTKGRIWIVDTGNNRLQRFDGATYAYLNQFGSKGTGNGQFNQPTGIAVDLGGGLWVVDSHNNRVQRFSEGGTYLDQIGIFGSGAGKMSDPTAIAVPADWQLLVVDSSNNRIQHWTQVPDPPFAATEAATSITSTSATLNAKVNPYALATTYRFEYDTVAYKEGEAGHGTSIPVPDESTGSGDKNVSVAKAISGLKSKTKYYFRVVATNASGTTVASQKTFTTS
jgi:DNA-binding beta-propeller fold protein YncE